MLQHRPAPPLAAFVDKLWYCEGYQAPHRQERVLPTGRFQLIIDLAERRPHSVVVGIRTQYSVIETAALESVMGAVFCPGGARACFDFPADELHNRVVPLDLVWGPAVGELRERLREAASPREKFRVLETTLRRRAAERLEMHAAVRYALGEFQRVPHMRRVLEVTREAGLSRRRLAQLFREQVGLTPKLYCRLHRFQEVVSQIAAGAPVDWADVAVAGGYYDQAHLAHEFHEFSGLSPGAWLARERPFRNHVAM